MNHAFWVIKASFYSLFFEIDWPKFSEIGNKNCLWFQVSKNLTIISTRKQRNQHIPNDIWTSFNIEGIFVGCVINFWGVGGYIIFCENVSLLIFLLFGLTDPIFKRKVLKKQLIKKYGLITMLNSDNKYNVLSFCWTFLVCFHFSNMYLNFYIIIQGTKWLWINNFYYFLLSAVLYCRIIWTELGYELFRVNALPCFTVG